MSDSPRPPAAPPDLAAFARIGAAVQGLPLSADYLPAVAANLAVAFRLAPLFLEFVLPDDAEPAPVFSAGEGMP